MFQKTTVNTAIIKPQAPNSLEKSKADLEIEEKLQSFFSKPRITEDQREELVKKFNFISKNKKVPPN